MSGKAKKAPVKRKAKANGYKMPAPIPLGEVIVDTVGKRRWRIGPSIGVGGFGEIYCACDDSKPPKSTADYPYVIKIEPHENGPLFVEKHFYMRNASKDDVTNYMKSNKLSLLGMPIYQGSGSHEYNGEKYRYLVLERYGSDLWTLFIKNGRRFPTHTVFIIGLQMLEVLEYIHGRGYVHADLKGANMLVGRSDKTTGQVYLVDWGLAQRQTDKPFQPDRKQAHNGTLEYTSRDAHVGGATMRGDMEILGYNMLQWVSGSLPWEKLTAPPQVHQAKDKFMAHVHTALPAHCPHAPDALVKYFEYVNKLEPKEMPDHGKCKRILEGYLKTVGKTRTSKLELTGATAATNGSDGAEAPQRRRGRPRANIAASPTPEDESDSDDNSPKPKPSKKTVKKPTKVVKKTVKRKSLDKVSSRIKKERISSGALSPAPKDPKPRTVHFQSPLALTPASPAVSKRARSKRQLVSEEEVIVKKVVRKIVNNGKVKSSWRDCPTVVNGRAPPPS